MNPWDSRKIKWEKLLGRTPRQYEELQDIILEALEKMSERLDDHYHLDSPE